MSDQMLRARSAALRLRSLIAPMVLLAFAASCDSSTDPGETVDTVEVTAQGSTTITVGGTVQLQATARNEGGEPVTGETVTWSSENEQVAQVSSTGVVTGVSAGTVQITATAGGKTGQITITVVEPLAIETESLPDGTVSQPYSAQLTASGGTGQPTWSIAVGSLPPGLTLDAATGIISGTPTNAGDYTFTVSAQSGGQTATKQLMIEVVAGPLALLSWYLPAGYAGTEYSHAIAVSGGIGEYEFSLTAGALPEGLTMNEDGVITGIPTGAPNTYFFEVTVESGEASAKRAYALSISNNPKSGFNIAVVNGNGVMPDPALAAVLSQSVAIVEGLITSDFDELTLPDNEGDGVALSAAYCGVPDTDAHFRAGEVLEDLAVMVFLQPIDGIGRMFGMSGLCGFMDSDHPGRFYTGFLIGDADDAALLGLIPDAARAAITHELIHVLGFDEFPWHLNELIEGHGFEETADGPDFALCGENPRYVGAKAVAAYQSLGGTGDHVPVQGGDPEDRTSGSCDRHWDTTAFDTELMSSLINVSGPWPISAVTLQSLEDLWYTTNPDAADPFTLPGTEEPAVASAGGDNVIFRMDNDVWVGPALLVRPDGSVTRFVPRGWNRGR